MYIVDFAKDELSESKYDYRTGQITSEWWVLKDASETRLNGCHCDRYGVGSMLVAFLSKAKGGGKAAVIQGKILAWEHMSGEQFVEELRGITMLWLLSMRGKVEIRMEQRDSNEKWWWTLSLEFTPESA